jgi:Tol biopolymer transport system component
VAVLVLAVLVVVPGGCTWQRQVSVTRTNVSPNGSSDWSPAAVSGDGRFVAFESGASDLVPGADGGVFLRDTRFDRTTVVSVRADGSFADGSNPAITPDGRYVVFDSSDATLVPGLSGRHSQVFVRDRLTATTALVSVRGSGAHGNGDSEHAAISADGRFIAFESDADNLVNGDTNISTDVFVRDRALGTTSRVNVGPTPEEPFFGADTASISADGRMVAFASLDDLGGIDTLSEDVYVRDLATGVTRLVSTAGGDASNGSSGQPRISGDGRTVVFTSTATNLANADTNNQPDIFVRNLVGNTTTRASRAAFLGGAPNGASGTGVVSHDGRFVAFTSAAWNIVAGDTNGAVDVFVYDRTTNQTTRVNADERGSQVAQRGIHPALSGDGRYVAFTTAAPLTTANPTGLEQVFLRHVVVPQVTSITPALIARGTSGTVVVSGRGFLADVRVLLAAAGVAVGPAARFNEQLFAVTLTAAPSAATGFHDVFVVNGGTGPGAGAGSVGSCARCLLVG